jgi:hypothetical protein
MECGGGWSAPVRLRRKRTLQVLPAFDELPTCDPAMTIVGTEETFGRADLSPFNRWPASRAIILGRKKRRTDRLDDGAGATRSQADAPERPVSASYIHAAPVADRRRPRAAWFHLARGRGVGRRRQTFGRSSMDPASLWQPPRRPTGGCYPAMRPARSSSTSQEKRLAGSRPTGDNGSFTVLVAPTDSKVSTTPSSNRFGSRLMASVYRTSDSLGSGSRKRPRRVAMTTISNNRLEIFPSLSMH